MTRQSTVFIASFIILALSSFAQARTIRHDLGGNVGQYVFRALQSKARGEVVLIDGICGSACTAYLLNPKTCATPRAVLIFHAGSKPEGTRLLWINYPAHVRRYLGTLTPRLVSVRGQDLVAACHD